MNRINLFCILWMTYLLGACYEDKGNYDYTDKFAIEIAGIENENTKLLLDTIKFRPTIKPSDREYECFWSVLPENGAQDQFDTISRVKDWDYVINLDPGVYKLRFCAKDVKTGIFFLQEYKLSVITDMSVGWWILKEEDGKTDLDMITPERKMENILKLKNGNSLEGRAKNIAYLNEWSYFDEKEEKKVTTKAVFVSTDQDVAAVSFFNGSILKTFDGLFHEAPVVKKPQNIFVCRNSLFLINDNHVYMMQYLNTGRFGNPQVGGGNMVISDYKTSHTYREPLLFDEKSSSFFTTRFTELSLKPFQDEPWATSSSDKTPVNNLNAELLYVGVKMGSSSPEDAYALFKSKTEEKYFLKKMTGNYPSPYRNPVISTRGLDHTLGIISAEHRAMAKDYNLMYFSKGNELWAFDVEELREVKQDAVVPDGEKVTYMEYLRFIPSFDKTLWFYCVIVGTTQGGKYTLYRYDVVAGKLQPGVKIAEGTGEVVRACYMYMNNSVYRTDLL